MIKGWKNKPEWVKYYEERDEKRAKMIGEMMIARAHLDHLDRCIVKNLKLLEERRAV
jgi:hypothetical protein